MLFQNHRRCNNQYRQDNGTRPQHPPDFSHGVVQAAVAGGGDGAGVEQKDVRLLRLGNHGIAGVLQQGLHAGGFTGVHLAAECVKITVQVWV